MNMKLLTAILISFVLSSGVEAIDASVQYRPGEVKTDYRRYRPKIESMSPVAPMPPYNFTPEDAGTRWAQEKPRYKFGNQERQEFALDVPEVSIQYKGKKYSVGGASAKVVAKWEDFGSKEEYGGYDRRYLAYGYQLRLNSRYRDNLDRSLKNAEIPETILHEVTHYLFDKKYDFTEAKFKGDLKEEDVRFIDEMLAFMNEGMSEDEALHRVERYVNGEKYKGIENAIARFKSERTKTSSQIDLSKLDLKDDNYDWCKCAVPRCSASEYLVVFGCSKCGKINREYARKALALEQKLKTDGKEGHWYGANAEANAHKAANTK